MNSTKTKTFQDFADTLEGEEQQRFEDCVDFSGSSKSYQGFLDSMDSELQGKFKDFFDEEDGSSKTKGKKKGDAPDGDKADTPEMEKGDASDGDKADTPEMEQGDASDGDKADTPDLQHGETPDGDKADTPEIENGETPDMEDSLFSSSSNAGIPTENPNIPANADDGSDVEKLDFSAEYASGNGMGNDLLSGTSGANTFEVNALLNAKPEIIQKHVDAQGKVDWAGVTGENNNYHDHWLESIGQDTISDFSAAEGDKININGHTVTLSVLEESDNQIKIGVYSDQGADGNRGTGAHDFDVVGSVTVNHDGDFDLNRDVKIDAESNAGMYEFA